MTLPAGFAEYLAARDKQRAARVAEIWDSLTEREQGLVKDAAVMGFVRGAYPHRADIPNDRDILVDVLDACDGARDLYPTITGYTPEDDE